MAIIIIRTLIVYFSLLLIMRILGKRQLGEMELSEFVLAALIADMAAHPLQDIGIPMMNGLVPVLVLFCCEVLISGLTLKSIRLRALFYGKPEFLIHRGQINQRELRKNRYTIDELMQELRSKGSTDISRVEYAVLETDGTLNVILYPSEQPLTAAAAGVDMPDNGYPVLIISDGRVLKENLQLMGRDMRWLESELKDRGHSSAKEVFCMTVDSAGKIYFAEKEQQQ